MLVAGAGEDEVFIAWVQAKLAVRPQIYEGESEQVLLLATLSALQDSQSYTNFTCIRGSERGT